MASEVGRGGGGGSTGPRELCPGAVAAKHGKLSIHCIHRTVPVRNKQMKLGLWMYTVYGDSFVSMVGF